MAQSMFQVPGMQHDFEYEELQGFRQIAILWSVSIVLGYVTYFNFFIKTGYKNVLYFA